MRGAAPVSAGASAELERLITAIRGESSAREVLDSDGDPAKVLQSLRSLNSEAGAAAGAYLDLVGYRLLDGFDISEPYALELSGVLLRAIRAAVEGKARKARDLHGSLLDAADRVVTVSEGYAGWRGASGRVPGSSTLRQL